MKRIAFALLILFVLWLAVGCSSTPAATPTPTPFVDSPQYISDEAIAIVKTFLYSRAISNKSVNYVSNLKLSAVYQGNGLWDVSGFSFYEKSGAIVPDDTLSKMVMTNIEHMNQPTPTSRVIRIH